MSDSGFKPSPRQFTVAVDLDNTLAEYDHFRGEDHIGLLRPGALDALLWMKSQGWRVIIWTCRNKTSRIWQWVHDHELDGLIDGINENRAFEQNISWCRKVVADLYIDDRAWPFCGEPFAWASFLMRAKHRCFDALPVPPKDC